jgi:hypothetical protein
VNKMMMMKIMTHFIHTSNFTSFAHHFHQMPSSNAIIFMWQILLRKLWTRRRRYMTHFTHTSNFTSLLFKWITYFTKNNPWERACLIGYEKKLGHLSWQS